jgi:hypothetical protein
MDRTPKLSSANGTTLILLGTPAQHLMFRVCFYAGEAFNVVWWAMTILTH